MKKLLLILTVLACGIGQVRADKTIRFTVRDEVGMGEEGRKLYIYIYNGEWIPTSWPGVQMDYLGTDGTKYWYEKFVTIPDDKLSSLQWIYTNNESSWGDGKQTVASAATDCTNAQYHSFIYAGESGKNQNLSNVATDYYIIDVEAPTTNRVDMTISQGENAGEIKVTSEISVASNRNVVIAPNYALNNDGTVRFWDLVYRPNIGSGSESIEEFQNYSGTATVTNNSQNWLIKPLAGITYKANLVLAEDTKNYSFSPYFTRTIGDIGYATFSADYAVAIPDGVDAYYTSATAHDKVTLSKFDAEKGIAASTGAILHKNGGGVVTFTPATTTENVSGTNKLVPTTGSEIYNSGKAQYILSKKKEGDASTIAFRKLTASYTPAKGNAYLEVASALAPSLSLFFDGEDDMTTGIDAIEHGTLNIDHYYDLQGRRVSKPTKGLYIVNGKKVVIK